MAIRNKWYGRFLICDIGQGWFWVIYSINFICWVLEINIQSKQNFYYILQLKMSLFVSRMHDKFIETNVVDMGMWGNLKHTYYGYYGYILIYSIIVGLYLEYIFVKHHEWGTPGRDHILLVLITYYNLDGYLVKLMKIALYYLQKVRDYVCVLNQSLHAQGSLRSCG